MKISKYNVTFPFGNIMILYNILRCTSMLLDKTLSELLLQFVDNITYIENVHPEFYKALVCDGYIVADDFDEVDAVEQLRLANLSDKSQYHLTINPTLDCNFHCWYCYESKVKDSEMSKEMINATILLIDRIILDNTDLKRFHIYFFGGEPLMKFEKVIKPILNAFIDKTHGKNLLCTLQITTNGVLLTEEMIDFFKKCNLFTAFQITFDGYGEHHNKSRFSREYPQSYNLLVDNIKVLVKNRFHVTLRINYSRKNVDDLYSIITEFKSCTKEERNRIIYTPVRIWQDSPKKVTKEACENIGFNETDSKIMYIANASIDYATSLGMQIMPINSIDSVRFPCKHSYINAASVNYNGDVFKCCARAFNEGNREGRLLSDGTISWKDGVENHILRKRTEANLSCRDCIIFPICGGGCVQSFKDFKDTEYCLYRYDEYSKIETVKRIVSMQLGYKL